MRVDPSRLPCQSVVGPEPIPFGFTAAGPGDNVLEAPVSLSVLVARNDRAAVALHSFGSSPNGLSFTLSLRVRDQITPEGGMPLFEHGEPVEMVDKSGQQFIARPRHDLFRLEVVFSDGRTARNVGHDRFSTSPRLRTLGGGGDGHKWEQRWWLAPLPPSGPLSFVCEWPILDINETCVEVSADPFISAAPEAVTLWPLESWGR
jgi:hypothetical protein